MAEDFPKKKTITWQMTMKLRQPGHKTKTLEAGRKKGNTCYTQRNTHKEGSRFLIRIAASTKRMDLTDPMDTCRTLRSTTA